MSDEGFRRVYPEWLPTWRWWLAQIIGQALLPSSWGLYASYALSTVLLAAWFGWYYLRRSIIKAKRAEQQAQVKRLAKKEDGLDRKFDLLSKKESYLESKEKSLNKRGQLLDSREQELEQRARRPT